MEPGQRCGFDVRCRTQEAKRKELGMSTKAQSEEMKLEIVVVPVSDVDRAKRFYGAWVGGSTPTLPLETTSA